LSSGLHSALANAREKPQVIAGRLLFVLGGQLFPDGRLPMRFEAKASLATLSRGAMSRLSLMRTCD